MIQSLVVWFLLITGATALVTFFEWIDIKNDVKISKNSKRLRSFLYVLFNMSLAIILQLVYNISIISMISLGILYQVFYWIEFDLFLNMRRPDKSWLYVSDNDRDDSDVWSDKLFHVFGKKYSGAIQMIFKLLLVLGLIALI